MIQLSTSPTTATITVTGDLDIVERDRFPEVTARLRGLRRSLVVVDLCGATFLDSTGAAFLASVAQVTGRRGGITVLRGASGRDLFVLEVCGALPMFRTDRTHGCPGSRRAAEADAAGPDGSGADGAGSDRSVPDLAGPGGAGPDGAGPDGWSGRGARR